MTMTETEYFAKLDALGLTDAQSAQIVDVLEEMMAPFMRSAAATSERNDPSGVRLNAYYEGHVEGLGLAYKFFARTLHETDFIDHNPQG